MSLILKPNLVLSMINSDDDNDNKKSKNKKRIRSKETDMVIAEVIPRKVQQEVQDKWIEMYDYTTYMIKYTR